MANWLKADRIEDCGSMMLPNAYHRRPHTISTDSAIVLKSGILAKKGAGISGNRYKDRLFELKINGTLEYFELKANGRKIKKGHIVLTSDTKIEKRSGGTKREEKFIIHNKHRSWYLWCKKNAKLNSVHSKSIDKNNEQRRYSLNCIATKYCNDTYNGYSEALEWCNLLNNMVESDKNSKKMLLDASSASSSSPNNNKCAQTTTKTKTKGETKNAMNILEAIPEENDGSNDNTELQRVRSYSYPFSICDDVGNISDKLNVIWALKESIISLKSKRYNDYYFVLRINGKLDWYSDATKMNKIGSIDLLFGSCWNIEKRKGSEKRDCKFIIFTKRKNYYFWCKNEKKLSNQWFHLMRKIIGCNQNNNNIHINNGLIGQETKDNCNENESKNEGETDDGFVPELFVFEMNYQNFVNLLDDNAVKLLHSWLPMQYQCYDWDLLYATQIDGCSMLTFYDKCIDQGPCIMVIQDEFGYLFGVFLSESISLSSKYFIGNSETFVFNIFPKKCKYEWKMHHQNRFFILCKKDMLTFGGGSHSALVMTQNFSFGISQKSDTFNNDILSKNVDFKPISVQIWALRNYW